MYNIYDDLAANVFIHNLEKVDCRDNHYCIEEGVYNAILNIRRKSFGLKEFIVNKTVQDNIYFCLFIYSDHITHELFLMILFIRTPINNSYTHWSIVLKIVYYIRSIQSIYKYTYEIRCYICIIDYLKS